MATSSDGIKRTRNRLRKLKSANERTLATDYDPGVRIDLDEYVDAIKDIERGFDNLLGFAGDARQEEDAGSKLQSPKKQQEISEVFLDGLDSRTYCLIGELTQLLFVIRKDQVLEDIWYLERTKKKIASRLARGRLELRVGHLEAGQNPACFQLRSRHSV